MTEILLLLFPRLNPKEFCESSEYRSRVHAWLDSGVGGFVLFGGGRQDVQRTTHDLRAHARQRLIFAVDAEFGLPMRFDFGTRFPSMMGLGRIDDVGVTESIGRAIGRELRDVDIDWNLAPVLDVNVEPANPIINIRSFGSDPERVAAHGTAYIRGLRSAGILSCGKHFPGHGRTAVDSHISLPVVDAAEQEMEACDFQPFRSAIESGVDSIMTGHLRVPALGAGDRPASLSSSVIARLREGLGFDGLVITDALDMGGVLTGDSDVSPEVTAFLAGNDIMEIPPSVERAIESLTSGMRHGVIPSARAEASLRRRERALERLDRLRETEPAASVDVDAHARLARQSADRALRVEENYETETTESACVALITPTGYRDTDRIRRLVQQQWPGLRILHGSQLLDQYRRKKDFPDTIWIVSIQPTGGAGGIDLPNEVRAIWDDGNPASSTLINLGSPYIGTEVRFARRIDTFSDGNESIMAAMHRVLMD